ncbi:hypothetical protein DRN75_01120, partial [Nanoarchaeota archaeon]
MLEKALGWRNEKIGPYTLHRAPTGREVLVVGNKALDSINPLQGYIINQLKDVYNPLNRVSEK